MSGVMHSPMIRPEVEVMLADFARESNADLLATAEIGVPTDAAWPQGGPMHPSNLGSLYETYPKLAIKPIGQVIAEMGGPIPPSDDVRERYRQELVTMHSFSPRRSLYRFFGKNHMPIPTNPDEERRQKYYGDLIAERVGASRFGRAVLATTATVTLGLAAFGLYRLDVNSNEYRESIAHCMSEARGYQVYLNSNTPDNASNVVADDPEGTRESLVKRYTEAVIETDEHLAEVACVLNNGDPTKANEYISEHN